MQINERDVLLPKRISQTSNFLPVTLENLSSTPYFAYHLAIQDHLFLRESNRQYGASIFYFPVAQIFVGKV